MLVDVKVARGSCQCYTVEAGIFRSLIGRQRARGLLFWFLVNFSRTDLNFLLAVIFNILILCDEKNHPFWGTVRYNFKNSGLWCLDGGFSIASEVLICKIWQNSFDKPCLGRTTRWTTRTLWPQMNLWYLQFVVLYVNV